MFGIGSSLKTCLLIFFTPPLKILSGKPQISPNFPPTSRQSEARNLETAHHIEKQKPDLSSTVNVLRRYETWGITPRGFGANYGEN